MWWSTASIALVMLLAIAVWTQFDRVPETVRTPPEPAAQRDRYLALERFTAAQGRPLTVTHEPGALDGLAPQSTLILGEGRTRVLTEERVARLFEWVDRGGHLILPAQAGDRDPVMRVLKVRVASGTRGARAPFDARLRGAEVMSLRIAGTDPVLKAFIEPFVEPLKTLDGAAADWSAGTASGPYLMHFKRGQGAVTVVASWDALARNESLGTADNAAVVWMLLNLVHREGPILLMTRIHVPTLWEWLRESAWTALLSAAVLLAVWLGAIVPRFGPLVPEPVPDRRALVEHLRAMGRAVWRTQEDAGLRYWLLCVRRSVVTRAAVSDPLLLRQSPVEQARAIATRVATSGKLDPRQVRTAMAGVATALEGGVAREGFTQVVAILQQVEANL
jgi:hypothetical protein